MRRFTIVALVLFLVPGLMFAQARDDFDPNEPTGKSEGGRVAPYVPTALLWDNGPLASCSGCGAGGADESLLQSVTLGMNTLGWGHQVAFDNRVADNFTIADPDGWDIDSFTFFAYQTGSTTASTITGVNLRIFDGVPGGGGTVVFGDTSTNIMTATAWSNIYRVTETTLGATNRPIMVNNLVLGAPLHLDPGTYWLDWQTDGTLGSGPWAPPVTLIGTCVTGDGLQSLDNGVTFAAALDSGAGACQQDFPFIIEGTVTGGVPTIPAAGLALLALALLGLGYYALWRRQHA